MLKQAEGFWGDRSKQFQQARRAVAHALVYEYRDRKARKRDFRRLWISRLNAACRSCGITYSLFIKGLKTEKVGLDRKVMSDMAIRDPKSFEELVKIAKG